MSARPSVSPASVLLTCTLTGILYLFHNELRPLYPQRDPMVVTVVLISVPLMVLAGLWRRVPLFASSDQPAEVDSFGTVRGWRKLAALLTPGIEARILSLTGPALVLWDRRRIRPVLSEPAAPGPGHVAAETMLAALLLAGAALGVRWLFRTFPLSTLGGVLMLLAGVLTVAWRLAARWVPAIASAPLAVAEGGVPIRVAPFLPTTRLFYVYGSINPMGSVVFVRPDVAAHSLARTYISAHEAGHCVHGHQRLLWIEAACYLAWVAAFAWLLARAPDAAWFTSIPYMGLHFTFRRANFAQEYEADRYAARRVGGDRCCAAIRWLQDQLPLPELSGLAWLRLNPTLAERLRHLEGVKE